MIGHGTKKNVRAYIIIYMSSMFVHSIHTSYLPILYVTYPTFASFCFATRTEVALYSFVLFILILTDDEQFGPYCTYFSFYNTTN